MKTKVFLMIIIILILNYMNFGTNNFDLENKLKQSNESENIRVLVKIIVPDLEILTKLSRKYKPGTIYGSSNVKMEDADEKLSEAIMKAANNLLHKLNNNNYSNQYIYKTIPYIAMSADKDSINKLLALSSVDKIFLDTPVPLPKTENNIQEANSDISKPLLEQSVNIIGADTAWGYGYTGKGWYVAVLDTGIRSSHEMFQGKNIIEACYSLGSNGYDINNGGCPNGKTEMTGQGSARHYKNIYDHGTHVTGIAAGNNKSDKYGVAKDSNVIAVQVFSYIPEWDDVGSYSSDQLKGLEYVYSLRGSYNIASVNMSLGGGTSNSTYCDGNSLKPIIDNLKAVGIATVIASGNEGFCNGLSSPACISSSISVNASTKSDKEYFSGNWHDLMLDLMAPGQSIQSAVAGSDTSYSFKTGTSMAAPHVAGAWAIIKQFDANFTVDKILQLFTDTGYMIGNYNCGVNLKPRINLSDALNELLLVAPPDNVAGTQAINRSFLQTEYINVITWEPNPLNKDKEIVGYKIYELIDNNKSLLAEVNNSTFEYLHRNQNKREDKIYALSTLDNKGNESPALTYHLKFGITQN